MPTTNLQYFQSLATLRDFRKILGFDPENCPKNIYIQWEFFSLVIHDKFKNFDNLHCRSNSQKAPS